jgi:C-terminal processing protease CtpA/Prc
MMILKIPFLLSLLINALFASNLLVGQQHYFATKVPKNCSIYEQNRFVYNVLHDAYLWSDETPHDPSLIKRYRSPESLLYALRNSEDRYSYIEPLQSADDFFLKGRFNNFGFIPFLTTLKDQRSAFIVGYVYPDSPAYYAGLRRGAIITEIDHILVTPNNLHHIDQLLKEKRGVDFVFWRDHQRYQKRVKKYTYNVKTISKPHIYQLGDRRVGYLVLSDFMSSKIGELRGYFAMLKRKNIDELILDLRYNGGGDVAMANYIASAIAGEALANRIAEYTHYNEKYSQFNSTLFFRDLPPERVFNLKRIFLLTTKETCSASERLIHNLKAYPQEIEVVQIGQKTCGKPYGFYGAAIFCNKVLLAINTIAQNSNQEEIDIEGITPTCVVEENFMQPLGDKNENYLKEALYYINSGHCQEYIQQ